MKLEVLIILIISFFIGIKSYAQKPIPLKEVNVYPLGYIKELLEKVNTALATNYETKKYFKYKIYSEAKIANDHILEQLNTTTSIKTNPLVFAYYFSKGRIEPKIIDSSFYKSHYFQGKIHSKFFYMEMSIPLGLDKKDFLTYNEKYEYTVKKIENIITIEFKSPFYCGTINLNPINFNLISIDYYNDESFAGTTKYLNNNDKTDILSKTTSTNYYSCSINFIPLKNNKFVIDSMNFDVKYQDYTINNLKDKNIKPTVFKKINTTIEMWLD